MPTHFPVRVQAIRSRDQNTRLYINFPLALAAAIGLEPGEKVHWELISRSQLQLGPPPGAGPQRQALKTL